MSNFAIEGLISGFNTTELINAILDIQVRGPVNNLEGRIQKESQRLTGFQSLNASLLGVNIATGTLKSPTLFNGRKATSSDTSTVSVTASSAASLGNFSLKVQNLAQADQVSSRYFTDASDDLDKTGKFILNGKTISVSDSDSLSTIANKITSANVGVKASIVTTAPNQDKLVLNATSTGIDKIELREVGNSKLLEFMGLIDTTQQSYDYTVNADTTGSISGKYDTTDTFTFTNQTFKVTDGGGQKEISVTLDGTYTLQQIADAVNTASTAQGGLVSASVFVDGSQSRLRFTSTSGIPSKFVDNDNALFQIGMLSGVQSEEFSSSTKTVGELMKLTDPVTGSITLQAGDGTGEITIGINFAQDSLEAIADRINTAAGGAPPSTLSARVISAGSLHRLEITSDSGHPVVVADTNNLLSTLGIYDYEFKNFDQQGENAQFTYNGVTVNRNTNLVTDLVEGVSLALLKENASLVNVAITEDNTNVSGAVKSFVDAFNSYASSVSELTFYDPNGEKNGILFGNSTVRELKSSLANALSRSVPTFPSAKLSELNDGTGIDVGSIKITDRSGKSKVFDLTGTQTVQDILDEINLQKDIGVRAEISSNGQSINLVDSTGSAGALKVEEVDGATTAADLGLKQQVYSNNLVGSIVYSGGATSLDSIGISLNTAGTLTFDENKLESALYNNPDLVKNLLAATNVGFANQFQKTLNQYTAFGTGTLDTASTAITNRMDDLNKQIEKINSRAETYSATLRKRFTALEVAMSKSQNLSQFLSQKLSNN